MKKVLIVDDDVNFCAVISAQLSLNNFNSLSLNCGHTAQAWLSLNQCDLVLTDLRMPNGSGVELISWIHKYR